MIAKDSLLLVAARVPLANWPENYPDHQAVGYTCTYAPEEIIHAAGFVPVPAMKK